MWGSCEKVGKLSRDNRQAASKVCLSQLRLLQDAWQELRQVREGGGGREGRDASKICLSVETASGRTLRQVRVGERDRC